jgi:hypothetical protein
MYPIRINISAGQQMPMKKTQIFTIVSGSALASGMAQGAVLYSGPVNTTITYNSGQTVSFDLNQDGLNDFTLGFYANNANKPYIQGLPSDSPGSAPLAQLASDGTYGLPVTQFGTTIDSNYLTPCTDPMGAYFNQEDNDSSATTVGAWGVNNLTEGYVGLEIFDNSSGSVTNFGWARLIYNLTAKTLILVDYAYETNAGVGIVAGATNEVGAPNIYTEPMSQTVGVGGNVRLSVTMLANPQPTFQWQVGPTNGLGPYTPLTNGGVISGATNATLTINGATAANQGDYRVVISNSLGAVTSGPPATLTVIAPVVTPTPQVLFGGLTAYFNLGIAGGLSPTFKWTRNQTNLSNGGRISGATNSQLQISNLQAGDSGNYAVVLTTGSLSVTSTVSSLTVLPVGGESLYEAAVLAAGPVAYYRLNDSGNPATNGLLALDNVAALNGVYGVDVTNGFDGVAGPRPTDGYPGFAADNSAALFTPDDTNSQITLAPLNLNTDTATFTFWVNPPAIQNYSAAILWSGTNSADYAGINYYYGPGTGAGMPGNVDLGYTWNEGGSSAYFFWDSGIMPPVDLWSMVALVIAPSNTTLYVLNNQGTNVNLFPGNNSIFPFTNLVMAFNAPETIGNNPNVAGGTEGFNGTLGEMAVFNQAMTQDQVQTLYNAALGILPPVNLQIATVGTNVQIIWPMGSLLQATNLNGPWITNILAVSPYTIAPKGSMFYRAVVP